MSRSRDALNRAPRSRSLSRSRDALNRSSRHSLGASQTSLDRGGGLRSSLGFRIEKMLEPEKMAHWLDPELERSGSRFVLNFIVYIFCFI